MTTASDSAVIETLAFSSAKAKLSELMTEVVHRHQLKAVGRHRGKEEMFLVGRQELLAMLEEFKFAPKIAVSEGEFAVRLPELGLVAGGSSLEEAFDELVELAEVYAQDYLDRLEFYSQTDRRRQLPWVARVAFTPADARAALFAEPPAEARALQPA